MPQPRLPLKYRRMQDSLSSLDSPQYKEEADLQDLTPSNMEELERAIQSPKHQKPAQQQVLQGEKQRIEQLRQQFTQRLQQRLNARIGTPEDSDPQAARAAFMARLMSKMRSGMAR